DLSLHKKMRSSMPDVIQKQPTDAEKTVHKVTYLEVSDEKLISSTQICNEVDITYSSVPEPSSSRKSPRVSPRSSPSGSLLLPKSSPRKISKNIKKYCEEADDYQEIIGQALLVAAKENSLSKIRDVLQPNLNVVNEEGKTPLIIT